MRCESTASHRRNVLWLLAAALLAVALSGIGTPVAADPRAQPTAVDAKIVVVWPHDLAGRPVPVDEAQWANIRVLLFERGTLRPVPCDFDREVKIWANTYGQLVPARTARKVTMRLRDLVFPAWEAEDLNVVKAITPVRWGGGPVHFLATVDGVDSRSNVWTHAAAPLTIRPDTQIRPGPPGLRPWEAVRGVITVVWPHDREGRLAPVDRAPLVNVLAQLVTFRRPGGQAADWDRPVRLYKAVDNGYLEEAAVGQKRYVALPPTQFFPEGQSGTVWDFNDVDVSAVPRAGSRYALLVKADGLEVESEVWVHGADARTIMPSPETPEASGANCPAP